MFEFLKPSQRKLTILASLYAALFVIAPVISNRIVDIFGAKVLLGSLLLAGEVSIFVSQYFVDVRVFDYLKTRYRSFIVRYNVSNLISYTLGLLVFLLLAFWDKDVDIVGLFFGQLGLRLVLQFALAPVFWILSPLSSSAEPIDPK